MEPARSKRKLVEGITKEEEKTYYVLEDGKFVPVDVNKGPKGCYKSPSPPRASDEDGKYIPVDVNKGKGYKSPSSPCSSDEDVDPVLKAEFCRQFRESDGFDCDIDLEDDQVILHKCVRDNEDNVAIFAKVGLHWYNFREGSNFQFLRVDKYNTMLTNICTYYITADAMDPHTNSRFVFQTSLMRCFCYTNEDFRIQTEICRIKPETPAGSEDSLEKVEWEYKPVDDGIDEFYKGDLKWLPDDALVESSDNRHQYYEVQDSDIRENDWLNLYAKYAFYSLYECRLTKLKLGAPLEIVKVVVQTCEAMEPKEKLKAGNAIFYIIFRGCGLTEEHRAVVRRTTDGNPQHVRLEAKNEEDLWSGSIP